MIAVSSLARRAACSIGHADALGQFAIGYLGQTSQPVSRGVSGVRLSTTWSYLPNSGDRRLAGIANATTRQYSYTTTSEDLISAINGPTRQEDNLRL
jgi:hypothetical protein